MDRRNLIWLDGAAGAAVGIVVLLFFDGLVELFALPRDLVRLMGWANVAYGAYSLTLASRRRRAKAFVMLLIVANATWALLCFRWSVLHGSTASFWGLAQLIVEGLFVGGLAIWEWRWRDSLWTE